MSENGPGRRELNKRARRGAIIDAAQRLVREHGYDAVTTGRIAAEAGVSPRTFFNYFDTKDEAVIGIRTDVGLDPDAARRFAAGGPTGHLLTDLRALIGDMLDQLGDEPARVRAAVELVRREPRLLQHHQDAIERHRTELLALLEERRAAAPFVADAETVLAAAGAVVQATTLAWVRSGGGHGVQVHMPEAIDELRSVLCEEAPVPGTRPGADIVAG
ncbi:TetR/AcrR family transcriptional regulator [Myceligenerans salitolerans]|uniref:TetR/AcrR family transcriptional regulator n=1 Tax=Myceligenerans salitolerans TaxID=1230528 RepID=A0ABS3IC32_9MICO|nr:TetR/AcrR family transcriptional regulator [Myceligenerans salitolerans]MBO0610003.1 TetR/AcrR family transcriptional regulator [Myceligenerans salitolerans]